MTRRTCTARPATLTLVLCLWGCAGPPASRQAEPGTEKPVAPPRHVFLITVDTLRADHTSAYGYPRATTPFLAQLALSGRLFEHPIVQWPKTGASFASIFTGLYPYSTGLSHKAALELPGRYLTLAEFFRGQGFTTLAVVSNAVLAAHLGWDQGFDEYVETWRGAGHLSDDPYAYRQWINAPRVNDLALPLLERYAEARRLFVWLHYSDPHVPYVLPHGVVNPFIGDEYYVGEEQVKPRHLRQRALGEHRELRYYVAQYDANVLVADREIARAMAHAEQLGLLGDSLVIYTSDHGESLGEHGSYFAHGPLPYNTTARVPLVLWAPELLTDRGQPIEQAVGLIDLYPTLREWIAPGVEEPSLEGRSLLSLLGPAGGDPQERTPYVFSEAGRGGKAGTHFRSLQDPTWKLVYHPARQRGGDPLFELYRLDRDPLETENLARTETRRLDSMRRELRSRSKEWSSRRPPQDTEQEKSAETRRALRAMGYIE